MAAVTPCTSCDQCNAMHPMRTLGVEETPDVVQPRRALSSTLSLETN